MLAKVYRYWVMGGPSQCWLWIVVGHNKQTILVGIWCIFVHAFLYMCGEGNQLDVTEWFIALIICSTCFGHLHAHHQELETILVLLPHMVCDALVVGGRRSGAGQQAVRPGWGNLLVPHPGHVACFLAPECWPSTTKASHTICDNNTSIISSSFWWWAYKCPKHVEQVISAINNSVASSWFSSLRNLSRHHCTEKLLVHVIFCFLRYLLVIIIGTNSVLHTTKQLSVLHLHLLFC